MISNIFNKCNNINKFHFFVRLKYVNREVKFIFIFKNNYTIHRLYKDNGNKSEGMNEAQKVNKFTIMN